ncbi:MAG: hypothetical protein QNJ31_01020 [Candidatus Caenarcaniphilales bacterium]|nr:hypothetical protein [Candidatus Caenarcaniphilales bacterium]
MYTLVLGNNNHLGTNYSNTNFNSLPVTYGSGRNDVFALNGETRGTYLGGGGDDTFDYGKTPGQLNTRINGGSGDDTFALSELKVEDALNALKNQGYSFVQLSNGFALRTRDGQEIRVINVQNVSFADKTFNLTKDEDLKAFVKALEDNDIRIIDETSRNNRRVGFIPRHNHYNSGRRHHYSNGNSLENALRRMLNGTSTNYNNRHNGFYPKNINNLNSQEAYLSGMQNALQSIFGNNFNNSYNNGFRHQYPLSNNSYNHNHFGSNSIRMSASDFLSYLNSNNQNNLFTSNNGLTNNFHGNSNYDFRNSINNFYLQMI